MLMGDAPIASMSEQKLAREAGERGYENAIRMALARGPWRFADTKIQLSRLVATPLNEWAYAYQLPADCCRVNRVYPDTAYEIYGDRIYSNQAALACDYEARSVGLEDIMPPHFERYAAHELLPLIVTVITSDDDKQRKAEDWRVRALGEALSIDAQQRPNQVFRRSPFIDVRRARRSI